MKQTKVVISLIMALMMIASTFVVVAGNVNGPNPGLTVEKTVWDGEAWVDLIYAEIGDDVRFNITITYYPVDTQHGYRAINLVVNDTLPPCLEYNDSAVIKHGDNTYYGESLIDGKTIWWYLTADYGIELWDNDPDQPRTVYIEFNATVVDYGENVNHVKVTGTEKCSNEPLFGEDDATVIVLVPERPGISVDKKVWDEDTEEWIDGPIEAFVCEDLTFKINVSNTGNVALPSVILKDYLPSFLTYNYDATGNVVVEQDHYIEWHLGTILVGGSVEVKFSAHVDDIGEDYNVANVTSCAGVTDEDELLIIARPHIIVDKQVWNGTAWADELGSVRKGEIVTFKITTTYYGDHLMKCMLVRDMLPLECLEYADNVKIYIDGELIPEGDPRYPTIYVGEGEMIEICDYEFYLPEGAIIWDWTDAEFALNDGETVVIEFDTMVKEYCCHVVENCVFSALWGCCPCIHYFGYDCVDIKCCPPPTTFTKKVLDGQKWVDEIETVTGSTLTFKLELEYFGNENLTEIQFVDVLPCILEFDDNVYVDVDGGDAELETVGISDNGKTIWFNFTGNLSDGGKITITFDVLVTGTTGGCCGCEPCICKNRAWVFGKIGCVQQPNFEMYDYVTITASSNCPPSIPQLTGDAEGEEDETLTFKAYTTDSDGDDVFYKFDYDDYTTGWLGPYTEGVEKTFTYSWDTAGIYDVRVKAKDIHGAPSEWSYPIEVNITEAEEPPEEGLDISIPMINIGGVSAILENTGELDINDITWNITVGKSGFLGSKVFAENNGTIDTLEGGNTTIVTSGKTGMLRFVLLGGYVRVAANSPDLDEPVEVTKKAYMIGPIVIVI